ncbi:MAG: hypothetical protein IKZ13_09400 [Akkermansia sp.]|nr:hypothetical protein [Akkermansia sp.]
MLQRLTAFLLCLAFAACTSRKEVDERPSNPLSQEPGQELAGFTANPLLPGGGGLGAETMRVTTEEELKQIDNGAEGELIWTDPNNPDAEIPGLTAAFENRKQGNGWLNNLGRGIKLARRESRPLIIWFHNSVTSPKSKQVGSQLLETPQFDLWCKDRVVRVKLDAGSSMNETTGGNTRYSMRSIDALAHRYGLQHYPALVVINSHGKITARIDGYDGYIADFETQLKIGVEQAETSNEEYKDKLKQRGYREWVSRKGEKLFAKLQRYDEKNNAVYLKEPGGRVSRTRLERFSKADIDYLDAQAREKEFFSDSNTHEQVR